MPFVETDNHLAAHLGISPALIRQIIHNPSFHYRTFTLPKSNGGCRKILAPKTYMKVIQWWILDNILSSVPLSDVVHGFKIGRNYVSNARTHCGRKHILNADIQDFFPSITLRQIEIVFRNLGYSENASNLLGKMCSLDEAAPTGAPTSPTLGNIILQGLDAELSTEAENRGMIYTRYADDLTFSRNEWIDGEFVDVVNEKVRTHGFELNHRKTRFAGPGSRMEVTGLIINNGLNPPRMWRNRARGYLHHIVLNPQEHIEDFNRVAGIYGSLNSIDPAHNKKLTRMAKTAMDNVRPYLPIKN